LVQTDLYEKVLAEKDFHDSKAKLDKSWNEGSLEWQIPENEYLFSFIKPMINKKLLLDIGCGPAISIVNFLNPADYNYMYVGVDISLNSLRMAKKNMKLGDFIQASGDKLPFKRESFKIVVALGFFHHMPNYPEALKSCCNVLQNGGILLAREPSEKTFRYKQGSPHEKGIAIRDCQEILRTYCSIIDIAQFNFPFIKIPLLVLGQIGLNNLRKSRIFWNIKLAFDIRLCRIFNGVLSGYDWLLIARKGED
jgi:ubiquinone/menaquinone biosynthesis C-methylase UbiE